MGEESPHNRCLVTALVHRNVAKCSHGVDGVLVAMIGVTVEPDRSLLHA